MTTQLDDLRGSLQRAIAVPGSFDVVFPDMGSSDILGVLLDALAEAQLDGFFSTLTYDDTGLLSADLDRPGAALVVIYAAARVLESQIRNMKAITRAKAGSNEFEQATHASVLVAELKRMEQRKADIKDAARRSGAGAAFYMADGYLSRVVGTTPVDWNIPLTDWSEWSGYGWQQR